MNDTVEKEEVTVGLDQSDAGPNGFTKFVRRVMSVLCLFSFFALLTVDFGLGITAKPIPIWMYILLFSAAAAGWNPVLKLTALIIPSLQKK